MEAIENNRLQNKGKRFSSQVTERGRTIINFIHFLNQKSISDNCSAVSRGWKVWLTPFHWVGSFSFF